MQLVSEPPATRTQLPSPALARAPVRRCRGASEIGTTWAFPVLPHYVGARSVTADHDAWSHATVVLVRVRAAGEVTASLSAECTRILISLEEVGGSFVVSGQAGSRRTHLPDAGAVSIIPAGMEATGSADKLSYLRHLMIQVDQATLEGAFGDDVDIEQAMAPRIMSSDPRVVSLAHVIADECAGGGAQGRVFRDSITLALLSALMGREGGAQARSLGGLAGWQVRRTVEFMLDNLASDIDLAQLAVSVSLSKSHFCRGFKETTGLPPHRWLLNARIEKAKEHLLAGRLSLAEIALDVGFSDQSHFTRTFSKQEDISPRAWLRLRL